MKNRSIWLDENAKFGKKVNSDLECEVLIIGGGITGLSTLYQLHKKSVPAILVERNKCARGVTARSTAKITYLQEKIYMNIRRFGKKDIASKYLESQIVAVKELKNIINKENIACDLAKSSSTLFTNDIKNTELIDQEYEFLLENKVNVTYVEGFKKAIQVNDTYVFHPVKYCLALKDKLQDYIYERSKVYKIRKENEYYSCYVNNHIIKAKYVVIATHYPYFITPLLIPFKSHVETSYIGAVKVKNTKPINAINIDKTTISYRYHNNYLIYLYNSLPSYNIKNIKYNFDDLKEKYNFNYIWSNKDIITNDYLPLIGRVYEDDDAFLVACGYNTWGMTNATLASLILRDIILKKENKYIELLRPDRLLNLNKVIRFFPDAIGSIKAIMKSGKNNVNNSKVIYTKLDNQDVAIYKDEFNKEHIVLNKCPHLKCGLVFNEIEKTWDCLCHGSRFDIDGKCIEGPSNYDITYKGDDNEKN